jgi:hydroxymethylpyrimidine/phosphomethylpyrimidine kinase
VTRPPRLLAIAGSDSSGRAGLQADLATFAAHGVEAQSVVTAVTAQGPDGVTAVHVVPAPVVEAQLAAAFAGPGVDAVKVGMLASAATVEVVARALRPLAGVPVVVDPVLAASAGGVALLPEDAWALLRERLLPLATLVTPNLPEAARLTGLAVDGDLAVDGEPRRLAAARELARAGCAVLLKGGHGAGERLVDILVVGEEVHRFEHPRLARATRGTGCVLSSAIAARLADRVPLVEAVRGGIDYLQSRIAALPRTDGVEPGVPTR